MFPCPRWFTLFRTPVFTKGSRKNEFTELALGFRLDSVDLIEHPKGICFAARNYRNTGLF